MLDIEIKEQGNIIIFSLKGDLTFKNTESAVEKFMQAVEKKPEVIGINCGQLKNLDSSGLGVFLHYSKEAKKSNINLIMINITDQISSLFDISKLNDFFELMTLEEFTKTHL